ncbi:MAG: hypothetical protein QOF78_55 [Phycisphaerales bacterium]|nr:hypothetical protein [Phycisphaerales bacterium]
MTIGVGHKSEARNPESETNPKHEGEMSKRRGLTSRKSQIESLFLFRLDRMRHMQPEFAEF